MIKVLTSPSNREAELEDFERRCEHLNELSRKRRTSPFDTIVWPERLDESLYWYSPSLLSVNGTSIGKGMDEAALRRLSKWECIQFFSINIHGERDVVEQIVRRFPFGSTPAVRQYLHHFLEEESQHTWFFSEFCVRYGGRVFANKKTAIAAKSTNADVETLLDFARILIFEEVGVFVNRRVARDESVHPLIREIHRLHDVDESRHIAFGRELFKQSLSWIRASADQATLDYVRTALLTFSRIMVDSLVSPTAYREAGFPDALKARDTVRRSPAVRERNLAALRQFFEFLESTGAATREHIESFDAD